MKTNSPLGWAVLCCLILEGFIATAHQPYIYRISDKKGFPSNKIYDSFVDASGLKHPATLIKFRQIEAYRKVFCHKKRKNIVEKALLSSIFAHPTKFHKTKII